jgi:uncharacterized protein YdhG (YjbR/CyaY superfamily)
LTSKDIDDYLSFYPKHVQRLLAQMRLTIKKAAPKATEKISYGIPTFALEGNLVHFAAFKNHIGFYPTASAIAAFSKELSSYKCSKGTVADRADLCRGHTFFEHRNRYRQPEFPTGDDQLLLHRHCRHQQWPGLRDRVREFEDRGVAEGSSVQWRKPHPRHIHFHVIFRNFGNRLPSEDKSSK